jgi:hypothetical protein
VHPAPSGWRAGLLVLVLLLLLCALLLRNSFRGCSSRLERADGTSQHVDGHPAGHLVNSQQVHHVCAQEGSIAGQGAVGIAGHSGRQLRKEWGGAPQQLWQPQVSGVDALVLGVYDDHLLDEALQACALLLAQLHQRRQPLSRELCDQQPLATAASASVCCWHARPLG